MVEQSADVGNGEEARRLTRRPLVSDALSQLASASAGHSERGIADGERAAPRSGAPLERLYRDQFDRLLTLARVRTGNAADAADLVHDAFAAVQRAYADRGADELGRLLYTTLNNLVSNHLTSKDTARRRQSANIADLSDTLACSRSATPEKMLIDTQLLAVVQAAIETLKPRQRAALHLRRQEGLKIEEIARRLSISPTTAKADIAAAMQEITKHYVRAGKRTIR